MRTRLLFLFLSCYFQATAQIKGIVTDTEKVPVSYANISVANTFITTVANEQGYYELKLPEAGRYILIFQQLGFQTQIREIIYSSETSLDIILPALESDLPSEKQTERTAVNLANEIIKQASRQRLHNSCRLKYFETDFYARGFIQGVPYQRKFLGYHLEQLDPSLKVDSLKNKFIYLSETISKMYTDYPKNTKETVLASKVTGSDNGLGFDTSTSADFDFYKKEVMPLWKLISPLAPIAPSYYHFKVAAVFEDPVSQKKIFKIEVKPKRTSEPVINGYLYIVDQSWEIYGVDAYIKGENVQIPKVNEFQIRQNFVYNAASAIWYKSHQLLDFDGSILVFTFKGNYNYSYHYIQKTAPFPRDTFSNEVIAYLPDANKKDSSYWNNNRSIPLTLKEQTDFIANDTREIEKRTRIYQDSIDKVHNKFNLFKLIQGYKYRVSHKHATYNYNGLLSTFAFNPVQGFNVTTGLWFTKDHPEKETFYSVGGLVNYGIAENKPRFSGFYTQLFNRVNYAKLNITGGSTVHQFGEDFPIKKIINSIAASWFGKNFAKYYQKDFIRMQYEQEIVNGLFGKADLEYAHRKPLFNNTKRSPFIKDKLFSSNNPLNPSDFENPGFEQNQIFKLRLHTVINFEQKYIRYPHKKVNFENTTFPVVNLSYEKGFAASKSKYNYDLLGASVKYQSSLGQAGNIGIFVNSGYFMNADNIAFMDYKHFYGNETFVGTTKNYLQNFNLLPYYSHSTNKSFTEIHTEHNFKGFVSNKIPFFHKLQWHLVAGAHALYVNGKPPYYEASVGFDNFGFGKFRPFRIDYVHSFEGGKQKGGIIVGIKFLNNMQ